MVYKILHFDSILFFKSIKLWQKYTFMDGTILLSPFYGYVKGWFLAGLEESSTENMFCIATHDIFTQHKKIQLSFILLYMYCCRNLSVCPPFLLLYESTLSLKLWCWEVWFTNYKSTKLQEKTYSICQLKVINNLGAGVCSSPSSIHTKSLLCS